MLEFNTGVSSKPIFRPAGKNEQIREGGTRIRVWLDKPLEESILKKPYRKQPSTLSDIIKEICLNTDADIKFQENLHAPIQIISSNEWTELKGLEFFRRISNWDDNEPPDYEIDSFDEFIERAEKNLQLIKDKDGQVIGRACIAIKNYRHTKYPSLGGALTVGGLAACSLNGIAGILSGSVRNTARDDAIPYASLEIISEWASEQSKLVPFLYKEPETLMECAQIIRVLGGQTQDLPIGYYQGKWVSSNDIESDKNLPDEIYLVSDYVVEKFTQIKDFTLLPNVISGDYGGFPMILGVRTRLFEHRFWPILDEDEVLIDNYKYFMHQLTGAVVESALKAWGVEIKNLPTTYIEKIDKREQEVIIGYVGESPIKSSVYVIRRPDNC